MSIRTDIVPGRVWRFKELPPNTIALDGAVAGPRIDAEGRRFSFDHHAGCIRLCTRATCEQVLDAILLGLDPTGMTVLLNHLDADTVLSVWLLENHGQWREPETLACVRPLVETVGASDAHGPPYPVIRPDLLGHFHAEILAPVRKAGIALYDDDASVALWECIERLDAWWRRGLVASASLAAPGVMPQLVENGSWVLADLGDDQTQSRAAGAACLYTRGYDRIVLCLRLSGCRGRYTIARRSDLVAGFPLPELYAALNAAEARKRGRAANRHATWGGGSTVGSSPRDGSVLSPQEVAAAITVVIEKNAASHLPRGLMGTIECDAS